MCELKKSRICRVWTLSPNLLFSICSIGFVQHIKAKMLLENGGQPNSQEENKKKTKDLQKKPAF
jgi:hypothetical protein